MLLRNECELLPGMGGGSGEKAGRSRGVASSLLSSISFDPNTDNDQEIRSQSGKTNLSIALVDGLHYIRPDMRGEI